MISGSVTAYRFDRETLFTNLQVTPEAEMDIERDVCYDRMLYQLRAYVHSRFMERVSVSFPATWWDHFKKRWLPWLEYAEETVEFDVREYLGEAVTHRTDTRGVTVLEYSR